MVFRLMKPLEFLAMNILHVSRTLIILMMENDIFFSGYLQKATIL